MRDGQEKSFPAVIFSWTEIEIEMKIMNFLSLKLKVKC